MSRRTLHTVGHRGAAGVLPENTLAGFRHAVDLGVDFVECDVHLCRDGKLVVMHDETVDRTTDGHGCIQDLTFAEIRELDAGKGERVPTLVEVLRTTKNRAKLLCELKGPDTEEAAGEAVLAEGMDREVIFTSFDLGRIAGVRKLGDDLQIGAIFGNPSDDDIARALDLGLSSVDVFFRNLRLATVEQVQAAGVPIRAWNPDAWPEMRAMIMLGVDGVSSNRPDILLRHLEETEKLTALFE